MTAFDRGQPNTRYDCSKPPSKMGIYAGSALQDDPCLMDILSQRVARSFRVRRASIFASDRCSARESLARHSAMYLMHVVFGCSYTDIAERFQRHRTSVLYACRKVEDRRDDQAFDARISRLEQTLRTFRRDG